MTDIATIGYAVDTRGLEKGAEALETFGDKNREVVISAAQLEAAARRAGVSIEEMRQRVSAVVSNMQMLPSQVDAVAGAATRSASGFKSMKSAYDQVNSASGALNTHMVGSLATWDMHRFHVNQFTKEMQGIGFAEPKVTAVLKRTREGFVQVQDSAQPAGAAVNHVSIALDAVGASADPAGRSLLSFASGLTILTAAGLIGGVFALANSFKELVGQLADLGETSKRALPDVERFQALRIAAGEKGLSGTGFDSGLSSMAAMLNETVRDENQLSKLLDQNNISYKEGNRLLVDTNKLLTIGADLVKRAATEQDKFRIAEMLGLTREWVPFLEQGSSAIEDAASEATRLGLVIDGSIVAKAKEFDAEWKRGSAMASAYIRAWLAESIPLVNQLINAAGEFASAIREGLNKKAPEGSFDLSSWLGLSNRGGSMSMIEQMNDISKNFSEMIQSLRDQWNMLPGSVEKADDAVNKFLFGSNFAGEIQKRIDDLTRLRETFSLFDDLAAAEARREATREGMRGRSLGSMPSGPRTVVPAKDDTAEASAWERAIKNIDRHMAAMKADTLSVGQNVQAHETLRAEFQLLEAAKLDDEDVTEKQIAKYIELRATMSAQQALAASGIDLGKKETEQFLEKSKAVGEVALALEKVRINSEIQFQKKSIFLSDEDRQIAQQLRKLYANDIPEALASSEAAAMRLNNRMMEIRDGIMDIGKAALSAALSGRDMGEAITNSLKKISENLAAKALASFMSGDWATGAVQGVMAIVAALASMIKLTSQAGNIFAEAVGRVNEFEQRRIGATFGNSLGSQLAQFELKASKERFEELKKGGQAMFALEGALAAERKKIIDDFNADVVEKEKAAAAERMRIEDAINQRRLTAEDRLFAATNDTTTLVGLLAAFDRQAARERLEEQKSGGEAMVELEAAQAAERGNIIKSFNEKELAETKRALQEKLDAEERAARQIVDYVNQLQVGPNSGLSPAAQLAAAQATYNAILPLAQAGNTDALGRITQDFENLRKAAAAVYGSTTAYQNILSTGISQLLALPPVAQTTDPVIAALADVETAVNNTKTAVDGTTTAVGTDTTTTAGHLINAVAKLDTAISKLGGVIDQLGSVINKLQDVFHSEGLLVEIRNLGVTSKDQLQLLNSQLAGSQNVITSAPGGADILGSISPGGVNVDNPMLRALNKIVWNTYVTAQKLGSMSAGNIPAGGNQPVFARGGWVNGPGGPHDDRAGMYALSNGEFVVNATAARVLTSMYGAGAMAAINSGRLPQARNGETIDLVRGMGRPFDAPRVAPDGAQMHDDLEGIAAIMNERFARSERQQAAIGDEVLKMLALIHQALQQFVRIVNFGGGRR